MSARPSLVRSIPFWILIAGSLATSAVGAWLDRRQARRHVRRPDRRHRDTGRRVRRPGVGDRRRHPARHRNRGTRARARARRDPVVRPRDRRRDHRGRSTGPPTTRRSMTPRQPTPMTPPPPRRTPPSPTRSPPKRSPRSADRRRRRAGGAARLSAPALSARYRPVLARYWLGGPRRNHHVDRAVRHHHGRRDRIGRTARLVGPGRPGHRRRSGLLHPRSA